MKISIKISDLIAPTIILIVIAGQVPWIIWDFLWLRAVINVVLFMLLIPYMRVWKTNNLILFGVLVTLISYFIIRDLSNWPILLHPLLLLSFFLLSDEKKIESLLLLRKIIVFIIVPSLFFWILFLIGLELPHSELNAPWTEKSGTTILYDNYYFFIIKAGKSLRFYSIFDEPGTLGTFLALLLASWEFKLDKINIFLFVAGLFTLSLAFVIIVASGIIMFYFKLTLKNILLTSIFVGNIMLILFSVPILKERVMPRIQTESITDIDNLRTSNRLDHFYKDFIKSKDRYFGKGDRYYVESTGDSGGESYKLFIIDYGLLGLIILSLIYLIMLSRYSTYYGFCILLLYALSFIQRPYALQSWQIILFMISIAQMRINKTKNYSDILPQSYLTKNT